MIVMSTEPRSLRSSLEWLKSRFGTPQRSGPERRTNERRRMRFEAELRVGQEDFPVVGVDIHEDGAKVLAPRHWEAGSIVFITLKDVQLGGFAEIRHCSRRKDGRYAIGLAFRGPLVPQGSQWQIQRVQQVEDPWTYRDDKKPEDKSREVA